MKDRGQELIEEGQGRPRKTLKRIMRPHSGLRNIRMGHKALQNHVWHYKALKGLCAEFQIVICVEKASRVNHFFQKSVRGRCLPETL